VVCPITYLLTYLFTYLLTYLFTYLLTYLLTPWCRIFFKKLISHTLSENSLLSLRNAKVHCRAHKSPPLAPILSQPNPIYPIDPYFPKIHLNVILPLTPRSSQRSLPFGPPNQDPVNTFPFPVRATCPTHFILLDLIIHQKQHFSASTKICNGNEHILLSPLPMEIKSPY
jgi:hypothetical protein